MLKIIRLRSRIIRLLLAALLIIISSETVICVDGTLPLFSKGSLKDPGSLAVKLQDTRSAFSKFLASQLSAKTRLLLSEYDGISHPSADLQQALVTDLNELIQTPLYDAQLFMGVELSKQTEVLLAQKPQNGEKLVYLNRFLLAGAYLHEFASPSEKQIPDDSKLIETCRENLRRIQRAREAYFNDVNTNPQWLSELCPQYLEKKALLCPADPTTGAPGVLTEGASDPILPSSYLYEFRPSERIGQEFLLEMEGDMLPIVRCQHHLLNLSVSGKLYRNGPQRDIYNNSTVKISSITSPQTFPPEVWQQMQKELFKENKKVNTTTVLKINPAEDLYLQLKEQFGEAFLKSPEGEALLKQLTPTLPVSINRELLTAALLGKSMSDIRLTNLLGEPIKLEIVDSKFILLNIFLINSNTHGLRLQHLEKLLENYDPVQLQVIAVSLDDSVKEIEAFKEKYQLSMPVWIDKDDQIRALLNKEPSKPQAEFITLLLDWELVVKDVLVDFDPEPLSKRVKKFVESKR